VTLVIVLAISYLLGAIPTSYIVVHRLTGRDIRDLGDGNPGMMNVWDSVVLPAALVVGFGDIGIHAVDALRWLAGSEAKSVYAKIGRLIHSDIALDDIGTMMIEFHNGVVASQQSGWANPAGNPTWLSVSFEVLGTAGTALIGKPYHDFELADGSKSERVPWWRADIGWLVNEFISAVEADREPAITGSDARAALELMIAAYRSSETGAPIDLPLHD